MFTSLIQIAQYNPARVRSQPHPGCAIAAWRKSAHAQQVRTEFLDAQ